MKFITKIIFLISLCLFTFLLAQKKWNIRYYHEIEGREAVVYADNEEWMPISTKFSFQLENMTSSLAEGATVVVPAKSKKIPITRFTPLKPNMRNGFHYTMTTNFGNALQETYDENYIYDLPFEKGRTQMIFQGYNGKFSHQNAYALDFNLKVGDPVHAAREGLVVETIDRHNRSCADISCAKFNNHVLIMHSDGTFGVYSHLKQHGIKVKPGDMVEKGQFIAQSGNTGYSNGPHLHFAVFINRIDGKMDYIKTKFRTSEGDAVLLQEKKSYEKNY